MTASRIATGILAFLSLAATARAEMAPVWSLAWLDDHLPSWVAGARSIDANASGDVLASYDVQFNQRDHARFLLTTGDGNIVWGDQDNAESHAIAAAFRPDGQVVAVSIRVNAAGDGEALSVRALDAIDGSVVWEQTFASNNSAIADGYVHHLAIGPEGTVYFVQSNGGDYTILRIDANGNSLPSWHWPTGSDAATPTDIAALPDGGVIVTGYGNEAKHGGYRSVRLAADGTVVFADTENGDIGNPLGVSYVIRDANGDFLLATTPESLHGQTQLRVWKLSSTGARLWTKDWLAPSVTTGTTLGGLVMASDGDAIAVVKQSSGDHAVALLRFRNEDGGLRYARYWPDDDARGFDVKGIVIAPNDRFLTPVPGSTLLEWTDDGRACRRADYPETGALMVAGGAAGWTMIAEVARAANQAQIVVERFDATAPCNADALYGDGFDLPE